MAVVKGSAQILIGDASAPSFSKTIALNVATITQVTEGALEGTAAETAKAINFQNVTTPKFVYLKFMDKNTRNPIACEVLVTGSGAPGTEEIPAVSEFIWVQNATPGATNTLTAISFNTLTTTNWRVEYAIAG